MARAVTVLERVARLLADPSRAGDVASDEWTGILCAAHVERLLPSLAERLAGLALPHRVSAILENARADARTARTRALWEAEMAARVLAPLKVPVVLLKGTAFVAAGLSAGQGRLVGDLDILVPRDRIDAVEAALIGAGWEWVKPDPYDHDYYKRWMHELPPLIHRERDAMIDVHHTILPLTARQSPDAQALIVDAVPLGNGLSILSPEDMIIHAAAHLFADGDLSGGLRNLWDIDRLLSEFDAPDFPDRLCARAKRHGLQRHVERALCLSHALLETPVETGSSRRTSDRLYRTRLTARDDWGRETRRLLRFAFYVRSHWIRMPPLMLARHLFIKWRRRSA